MTKLVARDTDGLHYVVISGEPQERAECAVSQAYWMVKNEASSVARHQWAMLLTAYITQRTVVIYGTGECTRWPDGEDIDGIELK